MIEFPYTEGNFSRFALRPFFGLATKSVDKNRKNRGKGGNEWLENDKAKKKWKEEAEQAVRKELKTLREMEKVVLVERARKGNMQMK